MSDWPLFAPKLLLVQEALASGGGQTEYNRTHRISATLGVVRER
jgi:hypothetical protein